MQADHDVYILEMDGKYRARPAVAAVKGKSGITFRNLTPHPVWVHLPQGLLGSGTAPSVSNSPQAALLQNSVVLAPNARHTKIKLSSSADGAYSYQADVVIVTVSPTDVSMQLVPVVGESGPKIIVDP